MPIIQVRSVTFVDISCTNLCLDQLIDIAQCKFRFDGTIHLLLLVSTVNIQVLQFSLFKYLFDPFYGKLSNKAVYSVLDLLKQIGQYEKRKCCSG